MDEIGNCKRVTAAAKTYIHQVFYIPMKLQPFGFWIFLLCKQA